ncbi:MAG: type II toxin-antitoxin system VapC family toxin [Actinobacteria bacterium]|nr:type II toxin-antitoxin system VapC family toxin [Actinomycetota bacterium]MCL6105206.1 type II toxin-antitoxin system VapC family toxin [Actinomycetota bacterium]
MTRTIRGLADTSVFIAKEQRRPIKFEKLPDEIVISVITVAELYAGVLATGDVATRARRLATLEALAEVEVLSIGEEAARVWAELRVRLAEGGQRVNVNDLWIAATAIANNLPIISQDSDFDSIQTMGKLQLIKI